MDIERIIQVLEVTRQALADLGACDGEACEEPDCSRPLAQVRSLLEELRQLASKPWIPETLRPMADTRYTIACPRCGSDLSVQELRLLGGDPEGYLVCGNGHEWVALIELWGPGPLTLFLTRREDDKTDSMSSAPQSAAQTVSDKLKALLQAKGFFELPVQERIARHEAAMRALEAVPRFNDQAAYRALGKA